VETYPQLEPKVKESNLGNRESRCEEAGQNSPEIMRKFDQTKEKAEQKNAAQNGL